jgi:hypothetical protein
MENGNPNETTEFLWRRLSEECPTWAVGVPVLFALLVVGLIVLFRQEHKLRAAIVGGVVVGIIAIVYLPLAAILVNFFSWIVILIPVMAVALFYVVLMYIRDARSVHWLWAFFLGLMRTCVYVILAVVFLLPGCQHFEKQEYESKVLVLFDVSGSMFVVDDLPEEGKKLQSRQDKIVNFMTGILDESGREKTPFIDRVVQKTPLTMYRFGPVPDETDVFHLSAKKKPTLDQWNKWLKPNKKDLVRPEAENLKDEEVKEKFALTLALFNKRQDVVDTLLSGTNIGGSCLQVHKLENTSFLQAIIVISDGQSNLGSDDARSEFLARVNNPKRPIPVITIGVGQFRLPKSIRIDDLVAPQEARPDDKFLVRVPVISQGMQGEEFTATLEVTRIKDVTGKAIKEEAFALPAKTGKFKGAGDQQQGTVEFEIDVQALKDIEAKKDEDSLLEGEWQFQAKVPRAAGPDGKPKEAFPDPFHVSESVNVQVQKRALRVLLFAGGATREYQFLRSILFREMTEKRMELCILLQTGREEHIDQDVEPDRMLAEFPTKLSSAGQKFMSLSDYDVIIAFDPDWTKLTKGELRDLNEWVGANAGGIIFVAGPVFSHQIARPGGHDFSKLLPLYPVVLKDNRLHGLGAGLGHDTSRPYALNFSPVAKLFDFIKLDEAGEGPIAGWNGFFWNDETKHFEPGNDEKPDRGFFTYYPVERVKPAAQVIATFAGPKESRIGDKTDAFKDQQPFIAAMPFGAGKTLYLGSGELWRLRKYKDGFHPRLWIKMARYVAAGAIQQKKYGRILMARNVAVGKIDFEAQIKGKDLLSLSSDLRPTVRVRRIDKNRPMDVPDPKDKDKKVEDKRNNLKFDLKAKQSDEGWQGFFEGSIPISEPGEYEFLLPIPGVEGEALRATVIVRKPNPELDNVRTNFGYLYQLASESKDLLNKLPPESKKKIELLLQTPEQTPGSSEKSTKRLFFPLSSADSVVDCLVQVPPKSDIVKGRFEDLWDEGAKTGKEVRAYWAALFAPLVIGLIGVLILGLLRQWLSAAVFFGICVFMTGLVALTNLIFARLLEGMLDVNFSYLLMLVVTLLGIEWLARKLLRLA